MVCFDILLVINNGPVHLMEGLSFHFYDLGGFSGELWAVVCYGSGHGELRWWCHQRATGSNGFRKTTRCTGVVQVAETWAVIDFWYFVSQCMSITPIFTSSDEGVLKTTFPAPLYWILLQDCCIVHSPCQLVKCQVHLQYWASWLGSSVCYISVQQNLIMWLLTVSCRFSKQHLFQIL